MAQVPVAPLWRLQRLQTRVALVLGTLLMALALLLALALSKTAEDRIVRLGATGLEAQSQQMARELSAGMDVFLREVILQTQREEFRNPATTHAVLREALDGFQSTFPQFAYAGIVDAATGTVVAASQGVFEGGSGRGRPVFEQGLQAPFLGDVHDAVRLAELLPKPPSGDTLRFLDVSAPIRDASGKVHRVFAAHVAWEWTRELREHVFGPLQASQGVQALLVDTAGKVVLGDPDGMPTGTDLRPVLSQLGARTTRVTWSDGRDYLAVVSDTGPRGRFPGFGWKVVARHPYEALLAPVRELRNAFLAGALLLGLATLPLAWMAAGRLVRPVRQLADAASAIHAGTQGADLPADGRLGEVSAVRQAIVTLQDSARLRAQEAVAVARQFALLAESLPQVVWVADAGGQLQYVNQPWIRRRQPEGDFPVEMLATLVEAQDRGAFEQAWRASQASGAGLAVRCRLQPADDAPPRWFDIGARLLLDEEGQRLRWVGTLLDVDDMVQLAQAGESALADERMARAEAERLARMRDEFLATVSHELRSPLNAISGWTEILVRKGSTDPMITKAADVIRRNVQLQAKLVSDLLDMSAVLASRLLLDKRPLDVAVAARDVVQSQLHAAQAKGVALCCMAPKSVLLDGDAHRLAQVISNLVGNALKFTEAGGFIEVAVCEDGGRAVLQVRDSGCGIAADFLPHVFDRMRQADSSHTRRAGGLGLGLAISRALVELHCGTLTAHSDGPGQGAVFTVSLPLLDVPAGAPAPVNEASAESTAGLQGLHVLLVDDEADAREVAQVALASLGAEVRLAASADEALQALRSSRFDVLVSDIGMPGMDGLALIRAVRQLPGGALHELPAVALSAFAMESDRQAGLEAGFQAYVAKPISLRRLAEAVHQALSVASNPSHAPSARY